MDLSECLKAKRSVRMAAAGTAVLLMLTVALAGCGKGASTSSTAGSSPAAPAAPSTRATPATSAASSTPAAPAKAKPTAAQLAARQKKVVTFAIVPKMLNNPVFTLAQRGAEQAAKNLEKANPGTTYNIIYQSSQTGVASEQADTITTLTAKKVDGMSISAIDANAVRGPIKDAVDAGIPVMCFDSDAPGSKRFTFFSVNDETIGQELAHELVASVEGPANMNGEVAIMSGQSSAPNLQGRVKGIMEVLNKKDFPTVTVLPVLYCDDNTDKSIEMIRTTMQAHPKLRGWIFVGGWPLFVKNALPEIDPNVTKVVSMDALPAELDYVKSGQVFCLIGQRCFDWGAKSVQILDDYRTGKNIPGSFVDAGFDYIFLQPGPYQRQLTRGFSDRNVYSLTEYEHQWQLWNGSNGS